MNTEHEMRQGDCIDKMQEFSDDHFHAVVTDPPYNFEGGFMGEEWDDIGTLEEYQEWCESWAVECRRVLKPGGHLIAFSGSRTHSHLFCGVHDAGFELRDTLTWHYSDGFPKGGDIGKDIDRWANRYSESDVRPVCEWLRSEVEVSEKSFHDVAEHMGVSHSLIHAHWCAEKHHSNPELPSEEQMQDVLEYINSSIDRAPSGVRDLYRKTREKTGAFSEHWEEREVVGQKRSGIAQAFGNGQWISGTDVVDITNPATTDAKRWEGWKQNLKPATEFAVLARKPLSEDAAYKNVLKHGTGALNISGAEIEGDDIDRYPSNVVIQEGATDIPERFFFTSKASKREKTVNGRVENDHTTVKPLDLMEWLVTLATAEGQRVLDPFAGSGTTIMACKRLNREGIGIEKDPDYAALARKRVELAHEVETGLEESTAASGQANLQAFADGGGE